MGSRKSNGAPILQPDFRLHHIGAVIQKTSLSGVDTTIANTDTSVEYQKYTHDATSSGLLTWENTRAEGIHTSVTRIRARDALGPAIPFSERKVFFVDADRQKSQGFADWNIFNAAGDAVGTTTGTTDTDVTPSGTWNERPKYD